jgi:2-C-methyl-D-erythritol 4-phosphate cytidylyltransferase
LKRYAVIVAGGSGSRMGSTIPKQFLYLNKTPVLALTVNRFLEITELHKIVLVIPNSHMVEWARLAEEFIPVHNNLIITVPGGETRFESVKNGLAEISEEGVVAIHDGVRPFVPVDVITNSFQEAERVGSAVTSVKIKDTIRISENGKTLPADRTRYRAIQTPQTFSCQLIKEAYDNARQEGFTDDAGVFEAAGGKINLIEGSYFNIKLTTPEDLVFAKAIIENRSQKS